jgi:hypothetical protein
MVKLNQIFERPSTNFSAKFFSTSDMTGTRSILLVSMQLSELNSYVKFLDDSFINNPISQTVDRTCLNALKEKPIQSLNVEAASMISTLLYSHFAGIDNVEIIGIEQALAEKTSIDESASSFLLEWLCYRYDKRLCSFAYHGALLFRVIKYMDTNYQII